MRESWLSLRRGARRDARVQRKARSLGHLPARFLGLGRLRLQREHRLAFSRTRRDPVGDRSPKQAVDRRLVDRIEGQTGIVEVARDEPRALEREANPLPLAERGA